MNAMRVHRGRALTLVPYKNVSKVGIAFCTLCSRMDFDAMHYAMHIIAAFCGILRRYLDISRSIMVVGV